MSTGQAVFDARVLDQGRRAERARALDVLAAALAAVDPQAAVRRYVRREGDRLWVDGRDYDLRRYRHVYLVGGGKASAAMAAALEGLLGERLSDGLVSVKDGYTLPLRRVRLQEAGHPLPDARGLAATRTMLELVRSAGADDLVLCAISGGGSALMTAPVDGVSLADLQALTDLLLRSGATINEMNAIRKHLSQVKGGQLAHAAAPATVIALLVSDVIGSPLDVIASGPTAPDSSTFEQAWAILERYQLLDSAPAPVLAYLERGLRGDAPETPKPGDPALARVQNVIVASNRLAAEAACERARQLGFHTLLLSTYIEGEAREVGRVLAGVARELALHGAPLPRPACLVAGGETTVTIRGQGAHGGCRHGERLCAPSGLGGRNQELALGAAPGLSGLPGVLVATLATDGSDGPTDAAGALVDGTTMERARRSGLEPYDYLRHNDSYHFFQRLGDLLLSGPTNTNVNDLAFVFTF